MKKVEFMNRLTALEREHAAREKELIKEYCNSNNRYKPGDIFEDHIGKIRVERVVGYSPAYGPEYSAVLYGKVLKKNGTPVKSGEGMEAFVSNDINGYEV